METRHAVEGVALLHHMYSGHGQIFQQPDPGSHVGWGGGPFKIAGDRHVLNLSEDFVR